MTQQVGNTGRAPTFFTQKGIANGLD